MLRLGLLINSISFTQEYVHNNKNLQNYQIVKKNNYNFFLTKCKLSQRQRASLFCFGSGKYVGKSPKRAASIFGKLKAAHKFWEDLLPWNFWKLKFQLENPNRSNCVQ